MNTRPKQSELHYFDWQSTLVACVASVTLAFTIAHSGARTTSTQIRNQPLAHDQSAATSTEAHQYPGAGALSYFHAR